MDKLFENVFGEIQKLLNEKERVLVAIDGRCASGKTTLAGELEKAFDCNVFHMDDFYLPLKNRTERIMNEPAGNIERERLLKDVLKPARKGEMIFCKKFNCKAQQYEERVKYSPKKLTVVEGSYSCHPDFRELYDLKIFLSVSSEEQKERIFKRNGEGGLKDFSEKWIPLEEKYFSLCRVEENCDLVFKQ